ncbi:tripartite tricarboxylate transporter substrate-binding protein [Muricoccus vinaceus]|uniref:Tripartite tricarboxylate transporter substrate-binding protein n=1 Tax=Muricoccus vinaceus TaxID=424704 RepID=A0ABV6IRW2_9PROT
MACFDRRQLLAGGALLAGVAPLRRARAQDGYPSKPIRLLLGFAPGGVADIVARLVAPRLSELLGQPVLVDNRPGAGGIVATEAAVRAAPDGHTLLWTTSSTATGVALYKRLPYDAMSDLAFASTVSFFDHVLAVAPGFEPRDLRQTIAYGRANPGRLNIGSISVGNAQHLGAELLRAMLGIEATVITYRGTPDLLNAVVAGDVQIASEILPPVLPQIQAARLRALAMATKERFPLLPDAPTAEESGLPGYVVRSWNGISAPAATPPAVVERVSQAVGAVMANADLRARLRDLGVSPGASSPAEFRGFFGAETRHWAQVIDEARIERQ